MMAERKVHFECPICGHDQYEEVKKAEGQYRTGPMPVKLVHYRCCGCTTHFSNPEKFSKKLKK